MPFNLTPQSTGGPLSNREKQQMLITAMTQLGPVAFAQKLATAALLPIVITMIENSFSRKTFQTDHIDSSAAMYTIKRRMQPVQVAKFGATPEKIFTYPRLTVVPHYVEVAPEIEMSDLLDAQFDAASDIMNDAGKEMAVKEDLMFLSLLATAAPDQGTTPTTVLPQIVAGPGGQGSLFSHNQYRVGTGAPAPDGGIAGEPGIRDLLLSRAFLQRVGYAGDTCLINPYGLGLFSSQKSFVSVFNSGSTEIMTTGTMTSTLGMRFVYSPLVPTATAYIFDTVESGRLVEREPITVQPRQEGHRMKWLVYERIAPFIRNANSILALSWYV